MSNFQEKRNDVERNYSVQVGQFGSNPDFKAVVPTNWSKFTA